MALPRVYRQTPQPGGHSKPNARPLHCHPLVSAADRYNGSRLDPVEHGRHPASKTRVLPVTGRPPGPTYRDHNSSRRVRRPPDAVDLPADTAAGAAVAPAIGEALPAAAAASSPPRQQLSTRTACATAAMPATVYRGQGEP